MPAQKRKRSPASAADPWEGQDPNASKLAGLRRWAGKPATEAAVTELPARLLSADARESRAFLGLLCRRRRSEQAELDVAPRQVLDCGAGVGRGTQRVLLRLKGVERVDLLEPAARLRRRARELLGGRRRVGRFLAQPLQDFTARTCYNLVWIQWVFMYIPDPEVVAFLQRCRLRLAPGGRVAVKENVEDRRYEDALDLEDLCATRTAAHFEALFRQGGFKVALKRQQKVWDKRRFPLMMWGLVPS
uniref:Alpha N-terminal protein methyltransferase 1 n=1 Tax=Alexandrium monilatum TaxID=311494 RepID=A0A7S4R2S1_9DINO